MWNYNLLRAWCWNLLVQTGLEQIRQERGKAEAAEHETAGDHPCSVCKLKTWQISLNMPGLERLHHCPLYVCKTTRKKCDHLDLWKKSQCVWKYSWSDDRVNTVWKAPTIPMAWNSYERSLRNLDSDQCSAPHLSEQLQTLMALCSGMLVLEATTTKIRQGYFLTLHMTEVSILSWQQSVRSKVCTKNTQFKEFKNLLLPLCG